MRDIFPKPVTHQLLAKFDIGINEQSLHILRTKGVSGIKIGQSELKLFNARDERKLKVEMSHVSLTNKHILEAARVQEIPE